MQEGYFYTRGSGAFVNFLYMGFGRIFGCELCGRRGWGGVGASLASLWWI